MIKISVIVPVYNAENHLDVCLKSLMNQTYPHFEVILIDDGSTDHSFSICKGYTANDSRFRVFRQKNAGQGSARNKGIKEAIGDYVVFCDADDYYERNALGLFADTAVQEKMPDLIIAGSQEFRYGKNDEIIKGAPCFSSYRVEDNREVILHSYMTLRKHGRITAPWAKAYKRDLLLRYNVFFPDLRRCQDVIFNLVYYDHVEKLCLKKDVIYYYQMPIDSDYTRKYPLEMFDVIRQVYWLSGDYLKKWNVYDDAAEEYLNRSYLKFVSVLLRLNYVNQWKLSKDERAALSRQMLNDETTVAACRTVSGGRMDQLIRFVVKSRSVALANVFSLGTIVYQKVRRKQK